MVSGNRTSAARNVSAGRSADVLRLWRTGEYERKNVECARIILRNRERYGPGMTAWAEIVLLKRQEAPGG